ncbi:helix-hairpin-helix domain-containing protein [Priestia endophytica]|uniref:helix-hairpin-helix domain-containing protein n=1 Tax=Priestia endophytica TaxID=135735 RepID=UPI00203DB604|nr:helix-hairpin-helix domain-containing protein [Priestia endophytica]MCM3539681.1 helix-hairpin-helix domain-containing protein [Priestia endophytica]
MEWLRTHKWLSAICGGLVCLLLLLSIVLGGDKEEKKPVTASESLVFSKEETNEEHQKKEEAELPIVIDVKGSVQNPGIYTMKDGERIDDAINKAGGFTKNAEVAAVNLAQKVTDEMVVYVPSEGEKELTSIPVGGTDTEKSALININNAQSEELQKLNGVGPSKAEAIITYREENGPFKAPEDIMNVSGFGEKSFEKIKEQITV